MVSRPLPLSFGPSVNFCTTPSRALARRPPVRCARRPRRRRAGVRVANLHHARGEYAPWRRGVVAPVRPVARQRSRSQTLVGVDGRRAEPGQGLVVREHAATHRLRSPRHRRPERRQRSRSPRLVAQRDVEVKPGSSSIREGLAHEGQQQTVLMGYFSSQDLEEEPFVAARNASP